MLQDATDTFPVENYDLGAASTQSTGQSHDTCGLYAHQGTQREPYRLFSKEL
jgi:hypothetical protein